MAKKRGVSVRISSQRIEALQEICEEMIEEFVPRNDHQYLLREYMLELKHNLQGMLKRPQENYTLQLSGAASIAFFQLWNMLDISRDKYANLIVDNLLKKMSTLAA